MKYENIESIKEYFTFLALDKSKNTLASYSSSLERFFDYLHVSSFEDMQNIAPTQCREYLLHLDQSGLKISSINAHLRPLKVIFAWLHENDHILKSPFQQINLLKEGHREVDYLTIEESKRIIAACKRLEDKAIIAVLLTTGLRREEIATLKLADYNGTHITVIGKGNKERTLPISLEVKLLLDQYIKIRNKKHGNKYEYLFISKKCKESKLNGRFSGEAIRVKVKHALLLADFPEDRIKNLSTHKLRHTFTSNLLSNGADIRVVQNALGHASINTTIRYAHMSKKEFDEAVLKNQPDLF
jgi:site-specific recombinase XerD